MPLRSSTAIASGGILPCFLRFSKNSSRCFFLFMFRNKHLKLACKPVFFSGTTIIENKKNWPHACVRPSAIHHPCISNPYAFRINVLSEWEEGTKWELWFLEVLVCLNFEHCKVKSEHLSLTPSKVLAVLAHINFTCAIPEVCGKETQREVSGVGCNFLHLSIYISLPSSLSLSNSRLAEIRAQPKQVTNMFCNI